MFEIIAGIAGIAVLIYFSIKTEELVVQYIVDGVLLLSWLSCLLLFLKT